jgi:hypothetical protein
MQLALGNEQRAMREQEKEGEGGGTVPLRSESSKLYHHSPPAAVSAAADACRPFSGNSRAIEFARRSVRAVPLTLEGTVGADQTSAR